MSETAHSTDVEKNKKIVEGFVEDAFNRYNLSALEKYYVAKLRQHSSQVPQGREAYKQYLEAFLKTLLM